MEISLNMLLDELDFEVEVNPAYGDAARSGTPRFSSVELLSAENTGRSGILYICALSEALSAVRAEGQNLLCARDRVSDESETPEALRGIHISRRDIDLRELFNCVQRVFVRLNEWERVLARSIRLDRGLQELLDLSEPILQNHITVQNASFKLFAYTKGIRTDDVISNELVKHGYHPPETVELFRKHRRLEQIEKEHGLIVSRDYVTSEFEVVKKVFRIGGTVTSIVVMVCCGRKATSGVLELFELFLEYIGRYVEKGLNLSGGNAAWTLVLDLVMGNVTSAEEARLRAAYVGFPYEGDFRFIVTAFADRDNLPMRNLVGAVVGAFPRSLAFSHEQSLFLLDMERGDVSKLTAVIDDMMKGQKYACGISDSFGCLWETQTAYRQTEMALSLAPHLGRESPVLRFGDCWIYHLLSAGVRAAPEVYRLSSLYRSLELLNEYSRAHRTDIVSLLRTYLENDRKATAVSQLLHMHRNTVLYHVEKVEQVLNVSLDDADVRLQLLLAFKNHDMDAVPYQGNS